MQFKHPEILYALFLLIIPILVHLFQLRRFKKAAFTNVKFLKEVELQTRKSSNLKKFLILISRLLLFAALIFAFANPFFGAQTKNNKLNETFIYLDNSFSMQSKGDDGELLKRAVQGIIKNTSTLKKVHLFTNNTIYENLSGKDLKNTLLTIDYYPIQTSLKSVLLKINTKLTKKSNQNDIILVSDFQQINFDDQIKLDSLNQYYITKLDPLNLQNISIDSVSIQSQDTESIRIKARIKNYGGDTKNVSVSLFENTILSGKSNETLEGKGSKEVDFKIPNTQGFNGKLQLTDEFLDFDNSLFFTLSKPKKINVTVIGEHNDYLSKIYAKNEFNFTSTSLLKFDYNSINEQHVLIFNALENIPVTLVNSSKEFLTNGGSLVIIPSIASIGSYTTLLKNLRIGKLTESITDELAITTIRFSHPLLKGVFEKKIKNFQYPTVKNSYTTNLNGASTVLKLENGKPFISEIPIQKGKVYWFAASIATENSNFKNSPLIVPIFYNIGLYSFQASQLYYTIGESNTIEISTKLQKDEVLQLSNTEGNFIPQQEISSKKVILTTELNPVQSGFFEVKNKDKPIKNIAYNYSRVESDLTTAAVKEHFKASKNIIYTNTVSQVFKTISDQHKTTSLWKIFILLALLFVIIEILLLKFLKS